MPGPSWRPFLGAFGVFALFLGLVFGGWVLTAGIIALIATLVGWLSDAVKEYRETVRADTTGHLANIPESGRPVAAVRRAGHPDPRSGRAPGVGLRDR